MVVHVLVVTRHLVVTEILKNIYSSVEADIFVLVPAIGEDSIAMAVVLMLRTCCSCATDNCRVLYMVTQIMVLKYR